jgi:hypothetical protein
MKRTLTACAGAVALCVLGASVVPAASPQVDKAIKTIQSIGADAGKMKLFCDLDTAADASGEKEDPALEKQMDDLLAQLGADFGAAWEVGDELDEKSPDSAEFTAAVEALAEKCP